VTIAAGFIGRPPRCSMDHCEGRALLILVGGVSLDFRDLV